MPSHDDLTRLTRKGVDRRAFLRTSGGVATGIAVTAVPTAAVALGLPVAASGDSAPVGRRVIPSGDVPAETVMAYVHDADKGHVTVVSGTTAHTYHDPTLARRLLAAAQTQTV